MDETFTVEKQEEFVSFKNINSDYLTVSTDGKLSFETTTSPGDQQMFVLSKHCSKGEKQITFPSINRLPSDYGQSAVRFYNGSGHYLDNVAANVLSNDPELYWHARYPAKQDWFVLDLGMAMSYDAVVMANTWCPPSNDGSTDKFKWVGYYDIDKQQITYSAVPV